MPSLFMYMALRSTVHSLCSRTTPSQNFNPFIPEFLKWTLPFLNLDLFTDANTVDISTSLISNNRLSRSAKSGPCFNIEIYQQATKYCGKEKLLLRSYFSYFPQYFQYISNLGVKLHIHSVKGGCSINCFPQFRANLICRSTDISKCFIANSVDPNQTARLLWIYTACTGISFGLPGCND